MLEGTLNSLDLGGYDRTGIGAARLLRDQLLEYCE
jgi:hypothetical protein